MAGSRTPPLSTAALRAMFDAPSPTTVGLEEEIMVLDAGTLDLAPRAAEVLGRAPRDERLKPELVAAQVEIATPPCATIADAVEHLAEGRRMLAAAAGDDLRLAAMAAHPFAAPEGELTPGARYEAIAREYGVIAHRQLCSALQVHVAVRPADRALAVHNALRGYLPAVAALAAAAPFHDGRDTGLASIRPVIAEQLPRQGVPPILGSWEGYAEALATVGDPGSWWWEVRPHPVHATLEVRVMDVQPTIGEAHALAELVHALVCRLAARHEAGETLPAVETWRIEEDRWSALRHGVAGPMGDRVAALLDELESGGTDLSRARALLEAGGAAARLREESGGDVRRATERLAERFLEGVGG